MWEDEKWFEGWFDSPYYHILYKNRDDREAQLFLDNILAHLAPKSNAVMLDLACGKGRHSKYLAQKGYSVTGTDLSPESITFARKFESENLSFFQHDMRNFFRTNYFDYIFNLFTSFGYFDTRNEHVRTLRNVTLGLKPDGCFVLDFFNAPFIVEKLVASEVKKIDGITFNITRIHEGGKIIKSIEFKDKGKEYRFREQVQAFSLKDMRALFAKADLQIEKLFGDYELNEYSPQVSPRLILIGRKK